MGVNADLDVSMPLVWFLPAVPDSVRLMRSRLRAVLTELPDDRRESVLLAAGELVTNAILHGEGRLAVTLWPSRDVVRVEVTDDGPEVPSTWQDPDAGDDGGRGPLIVDVLAIRWGVSPKSRGPGKTVWFEMGEDPN